MSTLCWKSFSRAWRDTRGRAREEPSSPKQLSDTRQGTASVLRGKSRILLPQCPAEDMRRYWNAVASQMKPFCEATSSRIYLEQEIEVITKHLIPNSRNKKMLKLDLWNEAFNTEVLDWASRQGIKTYALDVADKVVEIAHEKMEKLNLPHRFVVADMRQIPFESNTFDLVYSMGTLEHVADTTKVIEEIRRVLKTGGVAITGIPNKREPFLRAQVLALANAMRITPYGEELSFSRRDINRLFSRDGLFEIIDEEGIFLPWFLRYPDMIFYVRFRPACRLLYLPLMLVRLMSKIKKLRQTSGIITCVARNICIL